MRLKEQPVMGKGGVGHRKETRLEGGHWGEKVEKHIHSSSQLFTINT